METFRYLTIDLMRYFLRILLAKFVANEFASLYASTNLGYKLYNTGNLKPARTVFSPAVPKRFTHVLGVTDIIYLR